MSIAVKDIAPDFTLYSSDKQEVSLSDYKGRKVLMLFFPLAFTGVCTEELCSVRDDIATYNNLGIDVLGISVDSLFTLDHFKKAHGYNFPLLSDFNKEVSTAYGAIYDNFVLGMRGVSKRSAFLIGEDGTVKYAEVLDNAGEVPNFAAIKSLVDHS